MSPPEPVFTALFDLICELMLPEQTRWRAYVSYSSDSPEPRLAPRTGVGEVPLDGRSRWFGNHGWFLEQVEVTSVLEVSRSGDLAALRSEAESHATGYEIGPSPRIVDTVLVDYAAVGSVAARWAS